MTPAQFRSAAQKLHKNFCTVTWHGEVDVYAVIVYIPESIRRYRIVGMGDTMDAALKEAAYFKDNVLRELGIPDELLPMPNLGAVSACLKETDEHIRNLWAEFKNDKNITLEQAKKLFHEMDRRAKMVGKAFYEATKDRNTLEDCLTGCGSGEDHLGVPGWVPTQIRVLVDKWDQWGKLQETSK